ncbi:uncharacterized protein [Ptychodera flava]|uniref:uncharacterized protein isoform X8 n=1 Tax=Ptychodera flava TaxID=63121 RepID=UPI00396A04BC
MMLSKKTSRMLLQAYTIVLWTSIFLSTALADETLFECNFEHDFCGLYQDQNDDFDWTRPTGLTRTGSSGPYSDNTLRSREGHYALTVASSLHVPSMIARLVMPQVSPSDETICLEFYHNMYGTDTGELRVYVKPDDDTAMYRVWMKEFNRDNIWYKTEVQFQMRSRFQIIFEGNVENSARNVIAIDDVSLICGPCNSPDVIATDDDIEGGFFPLKSSPHDISGWSSANELVCASYYTSTYETGTRDYSSDINCGHYGSIDYGLTVKFSSPNYPANYPDLAHCEWIAHTKSGLPIHVSFEDFETEPTYDFIHVGEGDNSEDESSRVIEFHSGSTLPNSFTSSKDSIWIKFLTDNVYNMRGFTVNLRESDATGETTTDWTTEEQTTRWPWWTTWWITTEMETTTADWTTVDQTTRWTTEMETTTEDWTTVDQTTRWTTEMETTTEDWTTEEQTTRWPWWTTWRTTTEMETTTADWTTEEQTTRWPWWTTWWTTTEMETTTADWTTEERTTRWPWWTTWWTTTQMETTTADWTTEEQTTRWPWWTTWWTTTEMETSTADWTTEEQTTRWPWWTTWRTTTEMETTTADWTTVEETTRWTTEMETTTEERLKTTRWPWWTTWWTTTEIETTTEDWTTVEETTRWTTEMETTTEERLKTTRWPWWTTWWTTTEMETTTEDWTTEEKTTRWPWWTTWRTTTEMDTTTEDWTTEEKTTRWPWWTTWRTTTEMDTTTEDWTTVEETTRWTTEMETTTEERLKTTRWPWWTTWWTTTEMETTTEDWTTVEETTRLTTEMESTTDAYLCGETIYLPFWRCRMVYSPNYPGNYPNNARCVWFVHSASPLGYMYVYWDDFCTESGYDFVSVGNGDIPGQNVVIGQHSGCTLPLSFASSSNTVWMTFTSDYIYNDRGFAVEFCDASSTSMPSTEETTTEFATTTEETTTDRWRTTTEWLTSTQDLWDTTTDWVSTTEETTEEPTTEEYPTTTQAAEKGVTVTCAKTSMKIDINRSILGGMDENDLQLVDPECTGYSNVTHVTFETTHSACGTTFTETSHHIIYQNTVSNRFTDEDVIRRLREVEIPFECVYSRKGRADASFVVDSEKLYLTETGQGNFSFNLDFYHDVSYETPYYDYEYPIEVSLGERIYVGAAVETNTTDLELFLDTCKGTPTDDPNHSTQYVFIENGCIKDATVQLHPVDNPSEKHFSIEAFDFVESSTSLVYIHCDMLVCNATDPSSRCQHGCVLRHRRDVREVSSLGSRTLTQGPINLYRGDIAIVHGLSQGKDTIVESTSQWIMIYAAMVVFVMGSAMAVAAVLYARHTRRKLEAHILQYA